MLRFLKKKVYPIGIDLGSYSLKIIQVAQAEGGLELVAAAKAIVPPELRHDPLGLQRWYIANIKELLAGKPFKGRKVASSLPARSMLIQHMRLAKMDEKHLEKAITWESQEKLPFSTDGALLRHITACEVYEGDQSKLEVILMAASRNVVRQHLHLIEHTKTEIDSVNVEACALVNGFAYLHTQADQKKQPVMIVDLGHSCTKVVAAKGPSITFCRTIDLVAEDDGNDEAVCPDQPANGIGEIAADNNLVAPAADPSVCATVAIPMKDNSEHKPKRLASELRSCVRYHDLLFSEEAIEKVVFVGGQAKNKKMSQQLAQELGLPAQLGDPLARIAEPSRYGSHSDLESDQINSDWVVAFGLSLGGKV